MVKVQTGIRIDKLVFDRFKDLCKGERLMVGEAVQHLMESCLEAGSVAKVFASQVKETVGQRKAEELKLKGALAMLKNFVRAVEEEEWYVTVKDRETSVDQAVYRPAYETAIATLPKIRDAQLIREAERVLEEANRCVEKMFGEQLEDLLQGISVYFQRQERMLNLEERDPKGLCFEDNQTPRVRAQLSSFFRFYVFL